MLCFKEVVPRDLILYYPSIKAYVDDVFWLLVFEYVIPEMIREWVLPIKITDWINNYLNKKTRKLYFFASLYI